MNTESSFSVPIDRIVTYYDNRNSGYDLSVCYWNQLTFAVGSRKGSQFIYTNLAGTDFVLRTDCSNALVIVPFHFVPNCARGLNCTELCWSRNCMVNGNHRNKKQVIAALIAYKNNLSRDWQNIYIRNIDNAEIAKLQSYFIQHHRTDIIKLGEARSATRATETSQATSRTPQVTSRTPQVTSRSTSAPHISSNVQQDTARSYNAPSRSRVKTHNRGRGYSNLYNPKSGRRDSLREVGRGKYVRQNNYTHHTGRKRVRSVVFIPEKSPIKSFGYEREAKRHQSEAKRYQRTTTTSNPITAASAEVPNVDLTITPNVASNAASNAAPNAASSLQRNNDAQCSTPAVSPLNLPSARGNISYTSRVANLTPPAPARENEDEEFDRYNNMTVEARASGQRGEQRGEQGDEQGDEQDYESEEEFIRRPSDLPNDYANLPSEPSVSPCNNSLAHGIDFAALKKELFADIEKLSERVEQLKNQIQQAGN